MAIVTGDRYLESLVKFVEKQAEPLLEGAQVLKLNPVGLHYVQTRLEQLQEVEGLLAGAPVDYLRAYVSDLGDYRALEQLRRILRLLTSLKVVSMLVPPTRDPTPLSMLPFDRLKFLELRGCNLSTSAARGLLELRHTLEKIICYNSTYALRHVFTSRIVNIKDSPMWNKLTFVSCACNGLVPMDESLQLLPAVEILDLSRNRFAKVDNLRKCTKLRHLDLGFNHLRTIASLSEVSCPIVKLVLRNNALTTLRGIEHLKSVEGLDLSYNIISSFSELELLGSLSSLKSLWLEGNPICCARWYRAQVFSYFVHPDKLILDERGISKREFWKRHIVLASRLKKPAASGFYSPAKERCVIESTVNTKMKKFSRLASIEDDEPRSSFGLAAGDQEVGPLDGENLKRDEKDSKFCDEEIISTPNRNEFMKKERAVSWLRDFAGYPVSKPDITMDNKKFVGPVFSNGKERGRRSKRMYSHLGESSTCVLKFQSLEDEASKIRTESELSFSDASTDLHSCDSPTSKKDNDVNFGRLEGSFEAKPLKHKVPASSHDACLSCDRLKSEGRGIQTATKPSFAAIDDIMGSRSTSMNSASPPHYEKGILHRRHNLEEEVIQISAESYSVASSDSDTSFCDDDDSCTYDASYHVDFNLSDEGSTHSSLVNYGEEDFGDSYNGSLEEELQTRQITDFLQDSAFEPEAEAIKEISDHSGDSNISTTGLHLAFLEKRKNKRRPQRRHVSLLKENSTADNGKILPKLNGILDVSKHTLQQSEIIVNENVGMVEDLWIESISKDGNAAVETDDFVEKCVDAKITDHGVTETCTQSVHCSCMIQGSDCMEVDVVVLLSSESNIYVTAIDSSESCTGKPPSVLRCHKREDIKGILVGLGLQVVRVDIEGHAPYLFIMRSMENVRNFFCLLQDHDSAETNSVYSFRSWDQVQARKFEKDICKGSMMSIYLFSMLLVWHKSTEGWSWHSRSLFLVEGYLLVCTEDLEQFGYSVENDEEASPYFSLDVCCSIDCINEMVIETDESRCTTLIIGNVGSTGTHFLAKLEKEKQPEQKSVDQVTWRFKWFSQDTLYKFVGLLKAMHAGVATFPLSMRSTT